MMFVTGMQPRRGDADTQILGDNADPSGSPGSSGVGVQPASHVLAPQVVERGHYCASR